MKARNPSKHTIFHHAKYYKIIRYLINKNVHWVHCVYIVVMVWLTVQILITAPWEHTWACLSLKRYSCTHGISMLLEHLEVGLESAPPTTAELCTTSVNMVCCWEVRSSSKWSFLVFVVVQLFFRAQMAISLHGLLKLWQQQSTVCWSHGCLLRQSGQVEVERGICFFLVSGCMVEGGGLWSVCGLDVWRQARSCGYGYMSGFIGWVYTQMHTHANSTSTF